MSDAQVATTEAVHETPLRRRRRMLLVTLPLLVAALAGAATWGLTRYLKPPQLQGGVVTPPVPAYDFHLPDQNGRLVSLSDFRGKAVALTFLYTHCPDACPLIANKMHVAYQRLGGVANRVAFVAISVDPRGDTPASVREFLAGHQVDKELIYLTGSFAQLKTVWAQYFIGSDARDVTVASGAAPAGTPQQVGHNAIVYTIDPQGEIRAFLAADFDPKDLETNLRLLAPRPVR
jgi:protein SCO1/2